MRTGASRRWRSASSARSIRSPAGSSTTRARSGTRSSRPRARRSRRPASAPSRSPRSASRTSARRRWSGTAAPASRSATRSSGRTGAARRSATSCAAAASSRRSAPRPAWCSIRISRAPSCSGSSTTCPARAQRAQRGELAFGTVDTWLMWQLTGGQPAARRRDPRDRRHQRVAHACSSTSHAATGTTSCSALLEVPRALLPQVHPSSHVYGTVDAAAARRADRRSAASPATSRARCSARPASRPARPRTPTAPAASC